MTSLLGSLSLAVIGGGAMGSALLRGLAKRRVYPPEAVGVSEPDESRAQALGEELGIQTLPSNVEAATARIILLAVKPQVFPFVVNQIGGVLSAELVISMMAGITLADLESAFPGKGVVRTMPNTPALVGSGITAISYGHLVSSTQAAEVEELFRAVGSVITVAESQMDAVTALSGSGPGYFAVILEAMIDGGVQAGLARSVATQLALQTMLGTATLLQQENLHPALLKDRVTSPGGTTIAGITVLEQAGLRGILISALQAAQERSRQLRIASSS
ncbi:MAG: pyrroline-5-carboxylate reductase [Cyanobacteriota bacterium]|nr:pyrroline-5-carboxylate reductase [Cyanobacteriota bacterium]